ncbi:MAG TPA: hypothetical protein VGJ13_04945 [Pseudonocardiaceae bacterium]|jgi:hypothetical protein
MSDIEIPDAAYDAGERAMEPYISGLDAYDAASDVIRAAAPLVVATELRRLAEFLEEAADATKLLVRAAELESQGGTR